MKSEEEMWSDLADKMKEIGEIAHKKILDYFIANRLNKDEVKKQIIDLETASLNYYLNQIFLGMEEYELCQAFKEVLEERYGNPDKLKEYAEKMIQREMDAIDGFRKIADGIEIGSWDDLFSILEDRDIKDMFHSKYPLAVMIKLEMGYFKKRHQNGSEVFVDHEIIGSKLLLDSSLAYRLKKIYPEANINIISDDDKLIFKCVDKTGASFQIEYKLFELVYEGELR